MFSFVLQIFAYKACIILYNYLRKLLINFSNYFYRISKQIFGINKSEAKLLKIITTYFIIQLLTSGRD